MRKTALLALALVAFGCGSKPSSTASSPAAAAPAEPWRMVNNDPQVQELALLWNGLLGVRVGWAGTLRAYTIDNYESKGEEKILPVITALSGTWVAGGVNLSPATGTNFHQSLDMKTGLMETSWKQDVNGQTVSVNISTAISPNNAAIVSQKWQIESSGYLDLSFQATTEKGTGPKATMDQPMTCVWDWGRPVKERDLLSPDARKISPQENPLVSWAVSGNGLTISAAVDSGKPLTYERTLNFAPEDEKGNPNFGLAKPAPRDYASIAKESADTWATRWQTDIEIDGPVEDQQAVRSFLFYLRSAIYPQGDAPVSPMGLSNDIYNGHMFWDADIWVFPALALIDPETAKAISRYRINKLPQAQANFNQWFLKDGRPTARGKLGMPTLGGMVIGMKFPWESSVSGKETVPGSSKFEDHITGSVAFSMSQAAALGLVDSNTSSRFLSLADSFYRNRAHFDGHVYEIMDTVSPDENHTGDNDLYTNLVAQWCENQGMWDEAKVKQTMAKTRVFWAPYKLPKDDKTFLTYDNDSLRGYKQAAAVLSIYPLQYPPAEAQAKAMMDRFADKVIKNGPAMTDSIHALIWARLGEADKAYQEWRDGWQPFVKPPFLLFSEKRNQNRTYFTTGAAGCLQTVLYGFAGLRIDEKPAPGSQWSLPLKNGKILSIAPHLPKAWKKLTLKNLTVLGKRYTFEIANDKVSVKADK